MASLDEINPLKHVEDDRKLLVDAAVVRVMKARKVLDHSQLVAEVLHQISLFQPQPRVIKEAIESLIQREYLERDPIDHKCYRYLA